MEEDNESVVFSKGINFKELMSDGGTVFQIDVDFNKTKKRTDPLLMTKEDVFNDDDVLSDSSSDQEDLFKNIEQSAELHALSSPDYRSFDELAAKMTDCVPSGDVKILILENGSGPPVPSDAEITLHYAAYWEGEKIPFDSTLTINYGSPLRVRLGRGALLAGLEAGAAALRGPAARCLLLLAPAAAWGARGAPPRVRADRALFALRLLEVADVGLVYRFNDLPAEEQRKFETTVKTVSASNLKAKELFTKKLYTKATRQYHKTLSVLQISSPQDDGQMEEVKRLLTQAYLNLAVCYSKLNLPKRVLMICNDCTRVCGSEKNCKCLYYYGKAHQMLGEYDEAMLYYKRALQMEPKNREIGKAMVDLDEVLRKNAEEEKKMYRRVFVNDKEVEKRFEMVDEVFKKELQGTCEKIASRNGFMKFDLPCGLVSDEVEYIRALVGKFQGLTLDEDSKGGAINYCIIKK